MASTPTTLKIIFCFVIILITLVAGLIPLKVRRITQSPAFMGIANAFSAGVFIAIALMHVQPESINKYNEYMEEREEHEEHEEEHEHEEEEEGHSHGEFPVPQILIFAGYALILIIDRVLFDTHGLMDEEQHHKEIDKQ